MTKYQLMMSLLKGKCLDQMLLFSEGQDCMIFKGQWSVTDDVIYIPDTGMNNIITDAPVTDAERIDAMLDEMYTGYDFVEHCYGSERLGRVIFDFCSWEHPALALEAYIYASTEEEIRWDIGESIAELRQKQEQTMEKRLQVSSPSMML